LEESHLQSDAADGATAMRQEQPVAHPLSLAVGVVIMLATLGLVVLSARPPEPRPATAPANEFSAARAMALMERLLDDSAPHPTGSEANAAVGARIEDELTALGLTPETQTAFACHPIWAVCGEVINILSRLPGQTDGPAVLLTAHYDSVPSGPGAGDDMAGVAAILEVARVLQSEPPPRNPVILLLSDGEEVGLLGAAAFVGEHPWADDVGVVVNLEANGTHGQSILFETTENNAWLIDNFAAHAPRPVASSASDEIYELLPFNTDLSIYEAAGIPGINFAFTEEFPHYHTPLDAPANLDPGSLQHHGDNALAAARAFAALDFNTPPPGNSVYQDIVPGSVLRWPASWTIGIALGCAAVWLGLTILSIRRGELGVRALLWGLPVLPIGVLAAALLGWALGIGVGQLADTPAPWYANPLPMRVALWAAALLSVGLVASVVAPRAGMRGLLLGGWLWWSVLSVLLAWWLPAVSILAIVPTAFAGTIALAVAVSPLRTSPRAWELVSLGAVFGASWLWLWFARGSDYSAVGPDLGPTVAFAVGLSATALAPLLALPDAYRRPLRWALVGTALLIFVAAGVATRVPVYSELRPQRLNILHIQDLQSEQAFWAIETTAFADGGVMSVPEALRQAGSFAAEPRTVLPWSDRQFLVSPAEAPATPLTVAEVQADTVIDGERTIQLRLRVPDDALHVSLVVPEDAGLNQIVVGGTPHTLEQIPVEEGFQRFRCVGPRCDGLTLELHLQSEAAVTFFVTTSSPGLPQGGDTLIAARPTTAVPSADGDTTLGFDVVALEAS
jgi:hypothetical protein